MFITVWVAIYFIAKIIFFLLLLFQKKYFQQETVRVNRYFPCKNIFHPVKYKLRYVSYFALSDISYKPMFSTTDI